MIAATRPPRVIRLPATVALGLMLASDAAAHIDMIQPPPREVGSSREPNSDLKQGPCGQVTTGRTSTVSVFEPGETIEVTWRETINHRSYYRIAFDRDGDDAFPTFAGPGRGAQGVDPRELCPVDGQVILAYELEDGARETQTLRVTLPDVECERCTLQVVQYMFDANNPYYFQCADLALRRRGALDAGTSTDLLDASPRDTRDAAEAEPRPAPTCSSRIAPLDAGRGAPRRDESGGDLPPAAVPEPAAPMDPDSSAAAPTASTIVEPSARSSSGCAIAPAPCDMRSFAWLVAASLAACLRSRCNRRDPSERPQREGRSAEPLNARRTRHAARRSATR